MTGRALLAAILLAALAGCADPVPPGMHLVSTEPFDPAPGGEALAFDVKTQRLLAVQGSDIAAAALGVRPAGVVADGRGKLFATLPDGAIARIDAGTRSVEARWTFTGCETPRGLAIDTDGRRLFVGCANAVMLVVDADRGAQVARLPIGKDSGALAFDARRKLIFSANGDGTLSIYAVADEDYYLDQGSVAAAPGVRALAIDDASGRAYLVASDGGATKLLVLDPP